MMAAIISHWIELSAQILVSISIDADFLSVLIRREMPPANPMKKLSALTVKDFSSGISIPDRFLLLLAPCLKGADFTCQFILDLGSRTQVTLCPGFCDLSL